MTDSVVTIARDHADVNQRMPQEYWDYENSKVEWGNMEDYQIVAKIGRGKYSEVFEGIHVHSQSRCVIKVLKPVRESKILREIKILQNLNDATNVIRLLDCTRDPVSGTPAMIFEYIGRKDFKALGQTLMPDDVRYYLFELLKALECCHSRGIMHRDVKPHNIVIDPVTRTLRLIDWGLAEFYHPKTSYNVRVASRYYKGPELLIDYREYDYSVDMWSFGCCLAALMFRIDPFFNGADNNDQLVKITEVLGSNELKKYLTKYNKKLGSKFNSNIKRFSGKKLTSFVTAQNQEFATIKALDLLHRCLRFDHMERVTPYEAMQHPYFEGLN